MQASSASSSGTPAAWFCNQRPVSTETGANAPRHKACLRRAGSAAASRSSDRPHRSRRPGENERRRIWPAGRCDDRTRPGTSGRAWSRRSGRSPAARCVWAGPRMTTSTIPGRRAARTGQNRQAAPATDDTEPTDAPGRTGRRAAGTDLVDARQQRRRDVVGHHLVLQQQLRRQGRPIRSK